MELEEGDLDLTGSPLKCSFTLDDNLDLDVLPSTGKGRGYLVIFQRLRDSLFYHATFYTTF